VYHRLRFALFVLLSIVLSSPLAMAEEESCSSPSPDCAVIGKWEITASFGVGRRSNPVAGKSDLPLVVIPHISYYGKRFFLENLDLGFTLHEGARNTFSLIATPGYDRAFFFRNDLQNLFVPAGTTLRAGTTLPDGTTLPAGGIAPAGGVTFDVSERHTTYLLGPEWTFGYDRLVAQFDALREVTGRHDGYELRGALAATLLQSKGTLVASAGFTWKSADLVRYYYGVEKLYEPGSAFNPFIKARYSLTLSDRWTFNTFAQYEHLGSGIAESPLLANRHVTTFFAGLVFRVY
jgi:MipA family protein